jgi:hypothetical protein
VVCGQPASSTFRDFSNWARPHPGHAISHITASHSGSVSAQGLQKICKNTRAPAESRGVLGFDRARISWRLLKRNAAWSSGLIGVGRGQPIVPRLLLPVKLSTSPHRTRIGRRTSPVNSGHNVQRLRSFSSRGRSDQQNIRQMRPPEVGHNHGRHRSCCLYQRQAPPACPGRSVDHRRQGEQWLLTRKGVSIALRLLGHAQRGEQVSEALVSKREYTRFASPFQPIWQGFTLIQPDCHQTLRVIRYQFSSSTLEVRSAGQIASATGHISSTIDTSRQGQIHEDILRVQPG